MTPIIYLISLSLNVIVCYLIFESVNVPITDKTPGDFAFGAHAKGFCRCEYRGDYSAAFCAFGL